MNHLISRISLPLLGGLLLLAGGCVTAHEVDVKLEIRGHPGVGDIEDCLLLAIYSESLDAKGYWWVAEEESAGTMIPRRVIVRQISSGETIHQGGKVVALLGPYVRSYMIGWEYWLLHDGFQPDDFLDMHLERAYELEKPLSILLLPEKPGERSSNENVFAAARRIEVVGNFLTPDSALNAAVLKLIIKQLRHVESRSLRSKDIETAAELIKKLRVRLEKFPSDFTQETPVPASSPSPQAPAESQPTTHPTITPVDQPRRLLDLKPTGPEE